jgi:hypothetical protein
MWILTFLACSLITCLWMNRGGGAGPGQGGGKGGRGQGAGGGRGQGAGGGRGQGAGGGRGQGAGGGQGGRGRQGGNGKGPPPPQVFMLLQNSSVQEEIRIKEEQKPNIAEAMRPVRSQYREESGGLGELPPKQRRQKSQELALKITQASYSALAKTLEASQVARLQEIELQALGLRGLLNARASAALGLSADQKAKIQLIVEELGRKAQKLTRSGAGDASTRDQLGTLRKEAFQQGLAVLNAEQQKTWKSITGAPFQLKIEPRKNRQVPDKQNQQSDPFSFDDEDDL